MSHSTVMVVVREAADVEDAKRQAEAALEPFDENTAVAAYVQWADEKDVERATGYYTENPATEVGPRPDDNNAEALTKWTTRAIGLWCAGDVSEGVYEDGKYGYQTTYNPKSRWDWYSLGGRWRGFFQVAQGVKVGYEGGREPFSIGSLHFEKPQDNAEGRVDAVSEETKALLGESGAFGDPEGLNLDGRADLVRKGDVDFEAAKTLAGAEAAIQYDEFEKVTRGLEVPPSWTEFRENHGAIDPDAEDFPEIIQQARTAWGRLPWVKALAEAHLSPLFDDTHDYWCVNSGGREAYIERARNSTTSAFAVLLDGTWHEKGRMGWFGMSTDDMAEDEWDRLQSELIDGLPDDAWLALYDVHI